MTELKKKHTKLMIDALCKQEAIDFAEQLDGDGWKQIEGGKWYNTISHKYKITDYFTTEQLYSQFKNHQP